MPFIRHTGIDFCFRDIGMTEGSMLLLYTICPQLACMMVTGIDLRKMDLLPLTSRMNFGGGGGGGGQL